MNYEKELKKDLLTNTVELIFYSIFSVIFAIGFLSILILAESVGLLYYIVIISLVSTGIWFSYSTIKNSLKYRNMIKKRIDNLNQLDKLEGTFDSIEEAVENNK